MQIRCPNCERTFGPEADSADERYACPACQRVIYVDKGLLFPAVSAMTYPGQGLEAQPLKSFFLIADAVVPPELRPALQSASLQPHEETPPQGTELPAPELSSASAPPAEQAPVAQTPPPPEAPPVPPPMPPSRSVDDFQPEAMGAGSFASALTPDIASPPPLRAANLGGLMPPPWEQNGPPPLNKDESWTVAVPGAVHKKDDAEEFAKALGLPSLDRIQVHHEPKRLELQGDDDESPRKKSHAWLYATAATLVFTAGGIFLGLELQQKAPPPMPVTPPPPVAASQPTPPPVKATGNDEVSAEKRAEAMEHYSRGSKFYLQKKLPAAVEEFKKAIDTDPSFGLAHRGLGVAYASENRGELAIKEYKAYLKISPDAKDAKQVEQLVKNFDK